MATKKKVAENLIPAHQFKGQHVDPNCADGGYDPETNTFKPFATYGWLHEVLDAISAGVEAGVIDRNKWVSQIFADESVFRDCMTELAEYEQCFRMRDRWYEALFRIADKTDEEGFVTCEEIVDGLYAAAEETGQIEN